MGLLICFYFVCRDFFCPEFSDSVFFFFPVEASPLMMTGLGICLSAKLTRQAVPPSAATKPIVILSLYFYPQLNPFFLCVFIV